jgi:outer membrane protein assembly factor BamB
MPKRLTALIVCCVLTAPASAETPRGHWPQWRGPLGTGFAPGGDPPTEWSESKHIRWKVEIPGHGHATPIIWGDRIYIQTAIRTDKAVDPSESPTTEPKATERPATPPGAERPPREENPPPEGTLQERDRNRQDREDRGEGRRGRREGRGPRGPRPEQPNVVHQYVLLAIDRHTGKTIWRKTLGEEVPHEAGHPTASQASCSPITDGRNIIAHFGSHGVFCLDMDGNVLWNRDLGDMQTRNQFGEGSSPALHGDTVVVNWDHEGQSFITALDRATGKTRWKQDRDEPTSWATPVVLEVGGRAQVATSATKLIRSYDLASGDLVWQCGGMTANTIPSPVTGHGLLYCTSGFRGNALLAIRYADAKGDISGKEAVAWSYDGKGTPYVPSPLLYDDKLYFVQSNDAILSCVNAKTGKAHYAKERLSGLGKIYASPVGAGGRVYLADLDGNVQVLQHGEKLEPLATNTLDEGFAASPVVVGKELYLRGNKHLYCIAE